MTTLQTESHFAAVLFDMDGTLIDTEPYWLASEIELMARFGVTWSDEDQITCLGGPLPRVGQYMSDLAQAEDADFFEKTLVEMVSKKFHEGINFMPGALELLDETFEADIPVALVSASPRILVDAALARLPKPYFTVTISSSEVSESKPNPEGYFKAAHLLGVEISDALILEDSATGIAAAKASGSFVLAIPHIVELELNEKCVKVNSLEGLTLNSVHQLFTEIRSREISLP